MAFRRPASMTTGLFVASIPCLAEQYPEFGTTTTSYYRISGPEFVPAAQNANNGMWAFWAPDKQVFRFSNGGEGPIWLFASPHLLPERRDQ